MSAVHVLRMPSGSAKPRRTVLPSAPVRRISSTATCGAVREIKDDNRWDFVGTREEVEALGYEPCGLCGG